MTVQTLRHIIGQNIRSRRKAKGWTQAELAEAVDLTQPTIASIEAGNSSPQIETLAALAEALDTEPASLLTTAVENAGAIRTIRGMDTPTESTAVRDGYLTVAEVAERLGVTTNLVSRYCKAGRIEATRVAGVWIIYPEAVDHFQTQPRLRGRPRAGTASQVS